MKNKIDCVKIIILLLFVELIIIFIFIPSIGNDSAIADEMTTISYAMKPIGEILNVDNNPTDLAPPTYIVLDKIVSKWIRLLFPSISYVSSIKIATYMPYMLCMLVVIYWFYSITDIWGGIVISVISFLPCFMRYAVYNRIYTWALLFCTLVFINSFYIITRSVNAYRWFAFTFWIVVASSMHYICVVLASMVYLMIILKKRRDVDIKYAYLSFMLFGISIVCLFWRNILHAIQGINRFNKTINFYPDHITSFKAYIQYFVDIIWNIFASDYSFKHLAGIIALLWIIISILVIVNMIINIDSGNESWIWLGYMLIAFAFSFVVSLVMHSIIRMSAPRYYYPALWFFWIPIAWGIWKLIFNKKLLICILCICVLFQIPGIVYNFADENRIKEEFALVCNNVLNQECRYVVEGDIHIAVALSVYKEIYDADYYVIAIDDFETGGYVSNQEYSRLFGFELHSSYDCIQPNDVFIRYDDEGAYSIEKSRFTVERKMLN